MWLANLDSPRACSTLTRFSGNGRGDGKPSPYSCSVVPPFWGVRGSWRSYREHRRCEVATAPLLCRGFFRDCNRSTPRHKSGSHGTALVPWAFPGSHRSDPRHKIGAVATHYTIPRKFQILDRNTKIRISPCLELAVMPRSTFSFNWLE